MSIFLVNPYSGKGYAKQIGKLIVKDNPDAKVFYPSSTFYMEMIAKYYANSLDTIYAVGGDGTVNAVLNGIINTNATLGIIPCGSGNDFYRHLNSLADDQILSDVGKVNNKYFINEVSIGIDAEICANVDILREYPIPKNKLYQASIIYTLFSYKAQALNLNLEKQKMFQKYMLIAICNGMYYGNGYKINPHADITNQKFDIYTVDPLNKFKLPFLLKELKDGTYEKEPIVNHYSSNKIVVKSDNYVDCNYDGEILNSKSFEISMHDKKIPVYNNRKLIHKLIKR